LRGKAANSVKFKYKNVKLQIKVQKFILPQRHPDTVILPYGAGREHRDKKLYFCLFKTHLTTPNIWTG